MNLEEMLLEDRLGREATFLDKTKLKVSLLYKRLASKLKETAAVVSGKKLADNREYEGAPRVTQ